MGLAATATAGGGVMYSKIIRKEDKYAKRIVSPSYNRAARNMSFSGTPVMSRVGRLSDVNA